MAQKLTKEGLKLNFLVSLWLLDSYCPSAYAVEGQFYIKMVLILNPYLSKLFHDVYLGNQLKFLKCYCLFEKSLIYHIFNHYHLSHIPIT